jgi:hypothetical protein
LKVGYTAPNQKVGEGENARIKVSSRTPIEPDAFAVIGVRGAERQAALPLLVEYDRATKTNEQVLGQLRAHAKFARSNSLNERFPDLTTIEPRVEAEGKRPCWVPLLFATVGETHVQNIMKEAVARAGKLKWSQPGVIGAYPPQYMTTHARVHAHGVLAPVLSIHAPEREWMPLLQAMLTDYEPWLDGALPAHDAVLRLDSKGAHIAGNVSGSQPRRWQVEQTAAAEEAKRVAVRAVRQRASEAEAEARAVLDAPAPWEVSANA